MTTTTNLSAAKTILAQDAHDRAVRAWVHAVQAWKDSGRKGRIPAYPRIPRCLRMLLTCTTVEPNTTAAAA